jgi:hypothetical protein
VFNNIFGFLGLFGCECDKSLYEAKPYLLLFLAIGLIIYQGNLEVICCSMLLIISSVLIITTRRNIEEVYVNKKVGISLLFYVYFFQYSIASSRCSFDVVPTRTASFFSLLNKNL